MSVEAREEARQRWERLLIDLVDRYMAGEASGFTVGEMAPTTFPESAAEIAEVIAGRGDVQEAEYAAERTRHLAAVLESLGYLESGPARTFTPTTLYRPTKVGIDYVRRLRLPWWRRTLEDVAPDTRTAIVAAAVTLLLALFGLLLPLLAALLKPSPP